MSDHQPAGNCDSDGEMAPAPESREVQNAASDLPEPDFSRLRMARECLDAAFPQA